MKPYRKDGKWDVDLSHAEAATLDRAYQILKPLSELPSPKQQQAVAAAGALAGLLAALEDPEAAPQSEATG